MTQASGRNGDVGGDMTVLRPVPSELVTRAELASMMRCSLRHVDQLRSEGMPCVMFGRRLVRFRSAEAMQWAENRYRGAA